MNKYLQITMWTIIIILIGTCFYLILFSNLEDEPHTSTIKTDYTIKEGIIIPKEELHSFNITYCDYEGICNHTQEAMNYNE